MKKAPPADETREEEGEEKHPAIHIMIALHKRNEKDREDRAAKAAKILKEKKE